jgi:hypothetical protein
MSQGRKIARETGANLDSEGSGKKLPEFRKERSFGVEHKVLGFGAICRSGLSSIKDGKR